MNLKAWLLSLPDAIQYVAVLALVMVILYVCLTLTRLFGQNRGEKQYYNDPQEYDKQVPDLFASTFLRRKVEHSSDEEKKDSEAE